VTPETALRVSAVYGCVSRIAGAISTLPLGLFERVGADRQPVEHDYHWMLNERACDEMSAADAWTYLVSSKLFYGDGYAQLLRSSYKSARVIGWKPLHPNRVQPFRDSTTGVKYYRVFPEIGPAFTLNAEDMVQLTSLGYDGLTSPSPITYAAREAIGNALAAQQFSGKLFSEGATFDYALQTDQHLKQDQLEGLKASLLARTTNSRAPLILTGGLKPASLTINPKDAEILGTRLFSVEEICRIFGVPPHLVGHTEKTSSWGTGMAEQGGNFVRYTLMTHLVQIAQEFNHRLWPIRQRFFVQHVTEALEKGDTKSRYDAYRSALGRAGEQPFMDVDEIRRAENLPPRTLEANQVPTGATNAA
jgi:HK97 family phage portal protein